MSSVFTRQHGPALRVMSSEKLRKFRDIDHRPELRQLAYGILLERRKALRRR